MLIKLFLKILIKIKLLKNKIYHPPLANNDNRGLHIRAANFEFTILSKKIDKSCTQNVAGCLKEDNIDYEGNPIKDGNSNSMEDCAKWCGKEPKCKFWTYRKSDNRCWLKFSDSGRRENTKVISGTKNCATGDRDLIFMNKLKESFGTVFVLFSTYTLFLSNFSKDAR